MRCGARDGDECSTRVMTEGRARAKRRVCVGSGEGVGSAWTARGRVREMQCPLKGVISFESGRGSPREVPAS